MRSRQTPEHAAAIHRAEIHLTLALDPEHPLDTNETHNSLQTIRAECAYLVSLDGAETDDEDDRIDLARLNRIMRVIEAPLHYLKHAPLEQHPSISAECALVVSTFAMLRMGERKGLIEGIMRFLCIEGVEVEMNAVVIPALHGLVEEDEEGIKAASGAVERLVEIAEMYVRTRGGGEQRKGMIALTEIAVGIVSIVIRAQGGKGKWREALRKLRAALENTEDVKVLQKEVDELLEVKEVY